PNDNRNGPRRLVQRARVRAAPGEDDLGPQRDQFRRVFLQAGEIARHGAPAIVDAQIASYRPTQFLKPLHEGGEPRLRLGLVGSGIHEHAGASPHIGLLAPRRARPRRRRTAEQRDELARLHVWMAPAWQEIIWRAAQRSLAVMCPACWCSPGGLLALMGSANRVLIIQTGSMSR